MMDNLKRLCWPAVQLGDALEELSRRTGLRPKPIEGIHPPAWISTESEDLQKWIEHAAASLAVEAQCVHASYAEVHGFLRKCGPAVVRLDGCGWSGFLAVIGCRHRKLRILAPDLHLHFVNVATVSAAVRHPVEQSQLPEIERIVDEAGIERNKRDKVRESILRERLGGIEVRDCWLLRVPSHRSVFDQIREARLRSRLGAFVAAHTTEYLLAIAAWWVIGRAALQGRLDHGWLLAWALLLLTRIPVRLLATWYQGLVAISAGALLKRRLLAGSLRLHPDEVRTWGVGRLLGNVIESEALESLALSGGLTGVVALVEIIIAAVVLTVGADNLLLAFLLLAWTGILSVISWRYFRQRELWTGTRLEITNELVERMTGHRTRLAQEPPSQWHESEDEALTQYMEVSRKLDRRLVPLAAVMSTGWMILSLLVIAPQFVTGDATSSHLAVAVGSILLSEGALRRLTESLAYASGAVIAWRQVRTLFLAGSREETVGVAEYVLGRQPVKAEPEREQALLELRDLTYRYSDRSDKTLQTCSMKIHAGDRILLEGPSGGGKSTLSALLSGIREPDSGLILLRGLDRQTLGTRGWRQFVSSAPQFHENYVFSNTFAFNLLMGRRWPPTPEDFAEAEDVCRRVGLGDLLDRMPAGLLQPVGETGWQLSYGERTRLFLARALLQESEFLVLDESFGALDPDTLQQTMETVRSRVSTLMVIAHP